MNSMGAEISLEQALEYCLEELGRTGDVESSLRRYPQYADQVRPLLELAQATRLSFKDVPEAPRGLKTGRERMLAAAARQRDRGVPVTPKGITPVPTGLRKLIPVRFVALVFTVVMGLVILGGGLVWAARDSLPGDPLYPVKVATENGRWALAAAPAGRVDLALDLVEERAGEIQALAAAGRPIPEATVSRLEQHVEHALSQSARATDEEMAHLLAQVRARTRAQTQTLERVRASAPERDQPWLERAVLVCQRGAEAAEEGLSDPQEFRRRPEHHLEDLVPTAEPEQEYPQRQDQEKQTDNTRTPLDTPRATPQAPRTTSTPRLLQATSTPQRPTATATRGVTPQGPEGTATPQVRQMTATPLATPQDLRMTTMPQATPGGPKATVTPQSPGATDTAQPPPQGQGVTPASPSTPQGQEATAAPQPTSSGSGSTPGQPNETPGTDPPGGRQGGGH